jgi:hypothetical protein
VRVEENTAADRIELSAHQIERLNQPHADRWRAARRGNLAVIDP